MWRNSIYERTQLSLKLIPNNREVMNWSLIGKPMAECFRLRMVTHFKTFHISNAFNRFGRATRSHTQSSMNFFFIIILAFDWKESEALRAIPVLKYVIVSTEKFPAHRLPSICQLYVGASRGSGRFARFRMHMHIQARTSVYW